VDAYAVECGQHNPTQVRTIRVSHLVEKLPGSAVSTSFDALAIRKRLGKNAWAALSVRRGRMGIPLPRSPGYASIIISAGEWPCTDGHGQPSDDGEWWPRLDEPQGSPARLSRHGAAA